MFVDHTLVPFSRSSWLQPSDKHCKITGYYENYEDSISEYLPSVFPCERIPTNHRKFDVGASIASFDFGVNFSLKVCFYHDFVIRLMTLPAHPIYIYIYIYMNEIICNLISTLFLFLLLFFYFLFYFFTFLFADSYFLSYF